VLEGAYGFERSGRLAPAEDIQLLREDPRARETRELLERGLPPVAATKAERARFEESFDAVLRSLAFTHMNRLVAFELMEHPPIGPGLLGIGAAPLVPVWRHQAASGRVNSMA
jgi:hypothetical protein